MEVLVILAIAVAFASAFLEIIAFFVHGRLFVSVNSHIGSEVDGGRMITNDILSTKDGFVSNMPVPMLSAKYYYHHSGSDTDVRVWRFSALSRQIDAKWNSGRMTPPAFLRNGE